MAIYKLNAPLSVPKTKTKQWILNLNNYRNTHYQTLNKTKVEYKAVMKPQIEALPTLVPPIMVKFVVYPKTKQLFDVPNVESIHSKYFLDALVECGKLEDDNYMFVPETRAAFGAIDKENPRVVIYIKDSSDV